jgi:hypothetical protein
MMKRSAFFAACAGALVVTQPASAYVGPGAGLSLVGALWGVGIAIVAALGFVILWPLRRMLRGRRSTPPAKAAEPPKETSNP